MLASAPLVALPHSAETPLELFLGKIILRSGHTWSRTFSPDRAVLVFTVSVCESRIWGSLSLTHMFSPPRGLSL